MEVLVYCSSGYFVSKNCIREIVATTNLHKPVIALIDPETSHGGLSIEEVHRQLLQTDGMFEKWGFRPPDESAPSEDRSLIWPGGQALHNHIFQGGEPIEWNRIGHFQAVTMRLIAERLLPADLSGQTWIDGELIAKGNKPLKPPQRDGHRYHLYCSDAHNPGCVEVARELARVQGYRFVLNSVGGQDGAGPLAEGSLADGFEQTLSVGNSLMGLSNLSTDNWIASQGELRVTTDVGQLQQCAHMMLFLTDRTWTRGEEASDALTGELLRAIELQVHVLLAHEMPGVEKGRHACEFGTFFTHPDGSTPSELLKRGIYSEIAVPLKGGPWRETSMVLLGIAIGLDQEGMTMLEMSLDEQLVSGVSKTRTAVRSLRRGAMDRLSSLSGISLVRRLSGTTKTASRCAVSVSASSASSSTDADPPGQRESTQRVHADGTDPDEAKAIVLSI